jgi:hypothetical protein
MTDNETTAVADPPILSLAEMKALRPNYVDVPVPGLGTLRVKRLSIQDKLLALNVLADSIDESGKIANEDTVIEVWSTVMCKCIVNEAGEFEFDCDDGRDLIAGLAEGREEDDPWVNLREQIDKLNRFSAKHREEPLETAKNE